MNFYSLSKIERKNKIDEIYQDIFNDFQKKSLHKINSYFSNEDTYIRKSAYTAIGKIYFLNKELQKQIIFTLKYFLEQDDFRIRQTSINAAGEIGKKNFISVQYFFDKGLFDIHHSPRNAVIGSIKKMGEVNPEPVLKWAKNYLHHSDREIRREICHGIELRGRKYPQDILPLLKELQYDQTARVRNTLVHVLGQISYKTGCLEIVLADLKKWQNKELIKKALYEIIDVHDRYRNFSALSQKEAKKSILKKFKNLGIK